MDMNKEIACLVWGAETACASDAVFRDALVKVAIDICHETGDEPSFITFCARVIREFLAENRPTA